MRREQRPQNYANHVYRPVAWYLVWVVGVVAVAHAAYLAWREPHAQTFTQLLIALTAFASLDLCRLFALRLQNRIIRLEMQVRLARLGREDALTSLSLKQIIALRFASDAELPALIDRAVADRLTPDQIKRAVTNWQADRLRT